MKTENFFLSLLIRLRLSKLAFYKIRTYSGVNLNAEGPSRIEGVKFLNFKTTETRTGAGIRFAHRHRHQNGASTWAKDVTFNYLDSEGIHFCRSTY